jgi:Mycotoxin biosynthesis protein UstYa
LTKNLVGISRISEKEARFLPNPTIPIPGTKEYLIELDVWHELHCLNDLRMLLYPERFKGLGDLKDENGIIDRDNHAFRHWGASITLAAPKSQAPN